MHVGRETQGRRSDKDFSPRGGLKDRYFRLRLSLKFRYRYGTTGKMFSSIKVKVLSWLLVVMEEDNVMSSARPSTKWTSFFDSGYPLIQTIPAKNMTTVN